MAKDPDDEATREYNVPICGGLGAQLLGVMLVEHLRAEHPDQSVYVDLDYFQQAPRRAERGEGLSIFPWELDHYGLSIEHYNFRAPDAGGRFARRFGKRPHRLEDGSVERQRLLRAALSRDWDALFPISPEERVGALELLQGKSHAVVAVVHLRRGDYLNVASHVVSDLDVVSVLAKLGALGVSRFLFVSDDPVPVDSFGERLQPGVELDALDSDDVFLAHAVMRLAKCLVISNSQFSLSAAVLNPDGICLMPRKWFGGRDAALNAEINEMSAWSLLGVR